MVKLLPSKPLSIITLFVVVLLPEILLLLLSKVEPSMAYVTEINNQVMNFIEGAKREAKAAQPLYEDIPGIKDTTSDDDDKFSAEVLVARFEDWAKEQKRTYSSDDEKLYRFNIWIQNDVEIQKHNHKVPPPSFTMGHNQFSDMTKEEFSSMHTLGGP